MARASKGLVVCIDNERHPVSLERRKLYVTVPDAEATKHRQLRVFAAARQHQRQHELRGQPPRYAR